MCVINDHVRIEATTRQVTCEASGQLEMLDQVEPHC